jgi:hypothetical protein
LNGEQKTVVFLNSPIIVLSAQWSSIVTNSPTLKEFRRTVLDGIAHFEAEALLSQPKVAMRKESIEL